MANQSIDYSTVKAYKMEENTKQSAMPCNWVAVVIMFFIFFPIAVIMAIVNMVKGKRMVYTLTVVFKDGTIKDKNIFTEEERKAFIGKFVANDVPTFN